MVELFLQEELRSTTQVPFTPYLLNICAQFKSDCTIFFSKVYFFSQFAHISSWFPDLFNTQKRYIRTGNQSRDAPRVCYLQLIKITIKMMLCLINRAERNKQLTWFIFHLCLFQINCFRTIRSVSFTALFQSIIINIRRSKVKRCWRGNFLR